MASQKEHASADSHSHDNHPDLGSYLKVFTFLLIATVVTVAVAQVDLGALNTPVAFLIATIKALAVLAIFMHLKYDNLMNRAIVGVAVFFVFLMFFFCALDIYTRVFEQSTL
ncbi:MAG: cytochrome C oxidase subunit IV family protein [Pseudomonadota bacterium]|nr:cytochrome C oxidase subunit IV family protein [Pseudomonadota bacterium]